MSNYQAQYFDGNQYSLLTPNVSKSTETFGRLTSDKFSTKEYADKAFYTFHTALDAITPSYHLDLSNQTINTFLFLQWGLRSTNTNYGFTIKCDTTEIISNGYNNYYFYRSGVFLLSGDDLNGLIDYGNNQSSRSGSFIYLNKNTLLQKGLTFTISLPSGKTTVFDIWTCLK